MDRGAVRIGPRLHKALHMRTRDTAAPTPLLFLPVIVYELTSYPLSQAETMPNS